MINWAEATPMCSLLGGVLIGIAAAMLLLLNGKIAGISGIVGNLLKPKLGEYKFGDIAWRSAFLIGLVIAPLVYALFHPLPLVTIAASKSGLIIAGLLVGIGTRYGSGCTSGHGVCGIARLSIRSIVATISFMAAGMITVYLLHHLN